MQNATSSFVKLKPPSSLPICAKSPLTSRASGFLGATSQQRSSSTGSRNRTSTPQRWLQDTDSLAVRTIKLLAS
jgi:hypothetical protein